MLKPVLSAFIPYFKAKTRFFCVSVSENQRMEQQTLSLKDLHRHSLVE